MGLVLLVSEAGPLLICFAGPVTKWGFPTGVLGVRQNDFLLGNLDHRKQ